MARREEEREDLLREATALVERAEFKCGGQSIVAGFRRDGSASFFLSPEEVYQFNSEGELRRAFLDDRLYKAERGKLVRLTRQRSEQRVELVRHELTEDEVKQLLFAAEQKLRQLAVALADDRFILVGEIPIGDSVIARIQRWLAEVPNPLAVASRPGVR
jgi:S1-C subfamily serine protease